MVYIVAEDINLPLTDFVGDVCAKYSSSSILRVNKNSSEYVQKQIKTSPLLDPHWLVLINPNRMSEASLKNIVSYEENMFLVVCATKGDFEEICDTFNALEIEYSAINNLQLSKTAIKDYIQEELACDENAADYLAKRNRYFIPRIYNAVCLLKDAGIEPTRANITKYTENYSIASVTNVVEAILGYKKASKKNVLALLSNNKHAPIYLYKNVLKEIEDVLLAFDYIRHGALRYNNYTEFSSEGLKASPYKLKKYLDYFQEISFEKIYLLYTLLQREEKKDVTTLLKYVMNGGANG